MAWLAVDKDGTEWVFESKPSKDGDMFYTRQDVIELPKGSIEKLIGRKLTWEDEPLEI